MSGKFLNFTEHVPLEERYWKIDFENEEKRLMDIMKNADKIEAYMKNYNVECYLEFGNKIGNYTPAFSLAFLPSQISGHVKVEVDIEIADNDKRVHKCCFYVNCELGQVERFGKMLRSIVTDDEGTVISLT